MGLGALACPPGSGRNAANRPPRNGSVFDFTMYYSERVLVRSVVLQPLVHLAGMHHEQRDGSSLEWIPLERKGVLVGPAGYAAHYPPSMSTLSGGTCELFVGVWVLVKTLQCLACLARACDVSDNGKHPKGSPKNSRQFTTASIKTGNGDGHVHRTVSNVG